MNVKTKLNAINSRALTNQTQKVAFKLLAANGDWVLRSQLERVAPSASARVRDLRKPQFGNFTVDCASATKLKRNGSKSTFFYRIRPALVSEKQVQTVFRL